MAIVSITAAKTLRTGPFLVTELLVDTASGSGVVELAHGGPTDTQPDMVHIVAFDSAEGTSGTSSCLWDSVAPADLSKISLFGKFDTTAVQYKVYCTFYDSARQDGQSINEPNNS